MPNELHLCEVDPDYLKFLHKLDSRVSVKYNNRPFVGVITMISGIYYLLPLTSQTTKEREKNGKKKRAAKITTFVRGEHDQEIANILHNNMIPVAEGLFKYIEITAENTYEANEIRFIRKNRDKIINKAQKVHDERLTKDDWFLKKTCCDFNKLEQHYTEYKKS